MLPCSEASIRNSGPIDDVLEEILSPGDVVWEIGSGTGQHAVYFAERFPEVLWQPTDLPVNLDIIAARSLQYRVPNVRDGLPFNLFDDDPPVDHADIVYAANVIHIAPWEATKRLFDQASRVLAPGGTVFLYGPFRYADRELEPSNERFDKWLKERDSRSGIRVFEKVDAIAREAGFELVEDRGMPANNRSIWWRRRGNNQREE